MVDLIVVAIEPNLRRAQLNHLRQNEKENETNEECASFGVHTGHVLMNCNHVHANVCLRERACASAHKRSCVLCCSTCYLEFRWCLCICFWVVCGHRCCIDSWHVCICVCTHTVDRCVGMLKITTQAFSRLEHICLRSIHSHTYSKWSNTTGLVTLLFWPLLSHTQTQTHTHTNSYII